MCLTVYPPGPSVCGDSPGQNTGVGLPCPPPGDLHNPEIEPRSPTLQVYSLSSEPPGKPMNTGVDSLTFLQGIFPTQEMNQSFLHCRQILYKLSYQGSPYCGHARYRYRRPGINPWVGKTPGKGIGYHSSILAWRFPWTEKPGRLQSMGSQRVEHN